MRVFTVILGLLMLLHPNWPLDEQSIGRKTTEFAILYNADYTVRVVTTDKLYSTVSILQYDRILRNGGHVIHNHPAGLCGSFSYQDIENAVLLNLASTEAVSGSKVYFAVRNSGGWNYNYLGIRRFEKHLNKYWNRMNDCVALDQAWKSYSKELNFSYFSRIAK